MHITFLQSLLLLAAGSAGAAAAPVGTIVKIVAGKYSGCFGTIEQVVTLIRTISKFWNGLNQTLCVLLLYYYY